MPSTHPKLQIRLHPDVAAQVDLAAADLGLSRHAWLVLAVTRMLGDAAPGPSPRHRRPPKPRTRLSPAVLARRGGEWIEPLPQPKEQTVVTEATVPAQAVSNGCSHPPPHKKFSWGTLCAKCGGRLR